MARRCCDRWWDDQCASCGSRDEGRRAFCWIYGTTTGNGIPGFALGIMINHEMTLLLLGPFILGVGVIDD